MKRDRICSISYLTGQTDGVLVAEARDLFNTKGLAEGSEVWDHTRFIYRFVVEEKAERQTARDGLKAPPSILERVIQRWKSRISDLEMSPQALAAR